MISNMPQDQCGQPQSSVRVSDVEQDEQNSLSHTGERQGLPAGQPGSGRHQPARLKNDDPSTSLQTSVLRSARLLPRESEEARSAGRAQSPSISLDNVLMGENKESGSRSHSPPVDEARELRLSQLRILTWRLIMAIGRANRHRYGPSEPVIDILVRVPGKGARYKLVRALLDTAGQNTISEACLDRFGLHDMLDQNEKTWVKAIGIGIRSMGMLDLRLRPYDQRMGRDEHTARFLVLSNRDTSFHYEMTINLELAERLLSGWEDCQP